MASILVVEDDDDVALVICDALEEYGYRVERAKDGVAALDCLERSIPDAILSDYMMPRMNGAELVRRIRMDDRYNVIPIVMISSYDLHQELDDRVSAYLMKPFHADMIERTVSEVLKRSTRQSMRRAYSD